MLDCVDDVEADDVEGVAKEEDSKGVLNVEEKIDEQFSRVHHGFLKKCHKSHQNNIGIHEIKSKFNDSSKFQFLFCNTRNSKISFQVEDVGESIGIPTELKQKRREKTVSG